MTPTLTVALVGDVMLGREVNRRSSAQPFVPAPVLNVGLGLILIASARRPFRQT
jgi:hypothetical protein